MKRSIIFFTILLLFIAVAGTAAHLLFPTPLNRILQPGSKDVSFLEVEFIDVEPKLEWELLIPWSRDGLGGADRFLGERAPGLPESGGAAAPGKILIRENIIAINDRGATKLYDKRGNFLGLRAFSPIDFMPDGSLLVYGGENPLKILSPTGELIWEQDPVKAFNTLFLKDVTLDVHYGGLNIFVTPLGEIYTSFSAWLGRYITVPNFDDPRDTMQRWEEEKFIRATIVYDSSGRIITYNDQATPAFTFTPDGTAFTTAIKQDIGYAHREFIVNKGKFTLKRTLYLPSMSIDAVSKDGMLLCYDGYVDKEETLRRYAVYQEGKKISPRFYSSTGEWFVSSWENYWYTAELLEKGLSIRCWQWPKPER